MFKKLVRWFNERVLGFVYYEMEVYKLTINTPETAPFKHSGRVITGMWEHFEFAPNINKLESKMKKVINTFEGTPINKIKFVIKKGGSNV